MKIILRNLILFVISGMLGVYLSSYFGLALSPFLSSGGFFSSDSLLGIPLAYAFFTGLLFTAFGAGNKNFWLLIFLIPVLLIEVFDISHFYVPILMVIFGWTLGKVVEMVIAKIRVPKQAPVLKP